MRSDLVMSQMVPPSVRNDLLRCVLICCPWQFLPLPDSRAAPVTKEFRVVTSGFQVLRGNLNNESKYSQPMRENPFHCTLKQLVKKLNLSRVLAAPWCPFFLYICTVVQLVGFGCAAQPCAARSHILRLTNRQNAPPLRPPQIPCSFTLYKKSGENSSSGKNLRKCYASLSARMQLQVAL